MITDDGKVDVEISDMLLDQFSDSGTQTTAQDRDRDQEPDSINLDNITKKLATIGSYAEQRTLLTAYKARKAKVEMEKAERSVADIDLVIRTAYDTARRTRDAGMSISDRLAPVLAAESDVFKVRTILDEALRDVFDELYNEFIPKQKESHSA
jgi:hypothetical protein